MAKTIWWSATTIDASTYINGCRTSRGIREARREAKEWAGDVFGDVRVVYYDADPEKIEDIEPIKTETIYQRN